MFSIRRLAAVVAAGSMLIAAPAATARLSKAERGQNTGISRAQRSANTANRAISDLKTNAGNLLRAITQLQNGGTGLIQALGNVATLATNTATALGALNTEVNDPNAGLPAVGSYGTPSPEIGVVSLYAAPTTPGPGSGTVGTLVAVPGSTAFSNQLPRGGNNAAQATGTLLYNCNNTTQASAGCDLQVRAAIRTTRSAASVGGQIGGGVVVTPIPGSLNPSPAGPTVFAAQVGSGGTTAGPIALGSVVPFASSTPTGGPTDGSAVTFVPGVGINSGLRSDNVSIHLGQNGLYEIKPTLQFSDTATH